MTYTLLKSELLTFFFNIKAFKSAFDFYSNSLLQKIIQIRKNNIYFQSISLKDILIHIFASQKTQNEKL